MKMLKFCTLIFITGFLLTTNPVKAQTNQLNLHAVCTNAWLACMEQSNTISGEWTYHFTYHLDKAGNLEWIHWNVLHYDLTNDATGEEYILIDTGKDNMNYGASWNYFNSIQSNNTQFNAFYDQADGFLNIPLNSPEEGTAVYAAFKIKTKTGLLIGAGHTVFQLHLNAGGDLTGSVNNAYFDCY